MAEATPATPELLALESQLALARSRTGLNQAEAARRARIARSSLSEWESGKHAPSALSLAALADVYGMSVGELLGDQPLPAPITPDLRAEIERFAAIAARGDGAIPAADVAWRLRQILDATPAPTTPDRDAVVLVDEAAAHHLAAVILANLDDEEHVTPERPTTPDRISGWQAGMRRAAELVCESSRIAHTAPAVDEDQVQRVAAQAMRDWYLNHLDAPSDPEHWSDQNWRDMARAAITAIREVHGG